jgi:hypothetical protein
MNLNKFSQCKFKIKLIIMKFNLHNFLNVRIYYCILKFGNAQLYDLRMLQMNCPYSL